MKQIQNKRTLNDILTYIKMKSDNYVLKESMMTIAEATGYSNATIHRSLRSLEEQGMIKVIQTKSKKKPNTICYIGPDDSDLTKMFQDAERMMNDIEGLSIELRQTLNQIQNTVGLMAQDDIIQIH